MGIREPFFRIFRIVHRRVFGTRFARFIWTVPGADAFYAWLMPRVRPDVAEVDGHRIALDSMDSLLLSVNGNYESFEQLIFAELIRPGDTVIDVGAHIGLYTLQAARKVGPLGAVIAFEPLESNYRLLARNVEANDYGNVELVRAAVSNRAGNADLRVSRTNTGDNYLAAESGSGSSERVMTVVLDDFLGGRQPSVIKMDIQGAEPAALAGAQAVISSVGDLALFTELSPAHMRNWGGVASFVESLDSAGFELFEISEEDRLILPRECSLLKDFDSESTADHLNLICIKGSRWQQLLLPYIATSDALLTAPSARSRTVFVRGDDAR